MGVEEVSIGGQRSLLQHDVVLPAAHPGKFL
jgi:hypothetical protein